MGAEYFDKWMYSRELIYRCTLNAGGTWQDVYLKYYRPVWESYERVERPAVTVGCGGYKSPRNVFGTTGYNYISVTCASVNKVTKWIYYYDSEKKNPIGDPNANNGKGEKLNTIYWRASGDTDTSKWGGINKGEGLYVYKWWTAPDSWDSYNFNDYTFPKSIDLSVTHYIPENSWTSCTGVLNIGNSYTKKVYVTFPGADDYKRVTGRPETITGWKCLSGSSDYVGNTYGAGQKVTVARVGNYYFSPVIEGEGNVYKVHFDMDGGSPHTTHVQDYDIYLKYNVRWQRGESSTGAISSVTPPTKTGYTFEGYYSKKSGGDLMIDTSGNIQAGVTAVSSDSTWYAHWTPNTVILTANINTSTSNEGTLAGTTNWTISGTTATKELLAGSAYGNLPTVSYSNKKYSYEWYSAKTGGDKVNDSTTIGSTDTTIYARWTRIGTTLSLDSNTTDTVSGLTWSIKDLKFGDRLDTNYDTPSSPKTLPQLTRSGYRFKGWFTAKTGGTQLSDSSTIPSNAGVVYTIYAQWEEGYIVTLMDGSTKKAELTMKLNNTQNNDITSVTGRKLSGTKIFNGWWDATTGGTQVYAYTTDNKIVAVKNTSYWTNDSSPKWKYSGNKTLYARWITAYNWAYNSGWYAVRNVWVYNNGWKNVSKWWGYNGGWNPTNGRST